MTYSFDLPYANDLEESKLISLNLFCEDDLYFLSAKYHCVEKNEEYDLVIPKMYLDFPNIPDIRRNNYNHQEFLEFRWGNIGLRLCDESEDSLIGACARKENVVERPEEVEEVTMEDLEKMFGHKVKIVREKEGNKNDNCFSG